MSRKATEHERPEAVWIFEENKRVYPPGSGLSASPIWRKHWDRREIIGETSRSWLIGPAWAPTKIAKKLRSDPTRRHVAFSEAEIDLFEWAHHARAEVYRRATQSLSIPLADLVPLADSLGVEVPEFVRSAIAPPEED